MRRRLSGWVDDHLGLCMALSVTLTLLGLFIVGYSLEYL
jgi:hypothetical protein